MAALHRDRRRTSGGQPESSRNVVDRAMTRCDADERATGRLVVRDLGSRGAYYMRGFRQQMRLDVIRAIAARRACPAS
jgi:hypothetical protein